jgi:hypothetical protein
MKRVRVTTDDVRRVVGASNAGEFSRRSHVILSEAKDLMPVASGDVVVRFAQDDRTN